MTKKKNCADIAGVIFPARWLLVFCLSDLAPSAHKKKRQYIE